MQLRVKKIEMSTGGPLVAAINEKTAKELNLLALDRVNIKNGKKEVNAILDIATKESQIKPGTIGLFEETLKRVKGKKVGVYPARTPESIDSIRKKIEGKELTKKEIGGIIKDIVSNNLSDIEITYFVSACYNKGLSNKEVIYLTKATVKEGNKIKINKKIIADKHCIGGVPNNRTTLLITPIVAAAGLIIPKTSSRAITSPAGTADTMECLANVGFKAEKVKKIIKKTNACIVWNNTIEITGADSKLIKVRHPLRLDPNGLLMASIFAKKLAMGSTHLLIDIPIGEKSKIKSKKEANMLKKRFKKIAKKLGIKTKIIITDGAQPVGNGIGPALEAKDILYILQRDPRAPRDLEKKSIMMADKIFKLTKTKASAKQILETGFAYEKMKEIIKAQGGNPNLKPDQIKVGRFKYDYKAPKKGRIIEINNAKISKITRSAGAPQNKGSGVYLYKKLKDKVKRGEKVLTIYSENKEKLKFAKSHIKEVIKIK